MFPTLYLIVNWRQMVILVSSFFPSRLLKVDSSIAANGFQPPYKPDEDTKGTKHISSIHVT